MKFNRAASAVAANRMFGESVDSSEPAAVRRRPLPEKDTAAREMFTKLHRNEVFSVDAVHRTFTSALSFNIG